MVLAQIESLSNYDALCVTAQEFDAPLSCAARLAREASQGQKTLIVVLFDGGKEHESAATALSMLGVDQLRLRLPAAAQRSRYYASYVARMFGRDLRDESRTIERLWPILDGLRNQTRARHVYLPLGTGEVDHRLVQETGLRIFEAGAMRNVLLYEERPYAFVPGAIHIRLAQLGSRLPPALTDIGDHASLLRVLWGASTAKHVKRNAHGLVARAAYIWRSWLAWRQSRGWQPRKAFGLRVQPIVHEITAETAEAAGQALQSVARAAPERLGTVAELHAYMQRYARRLGKSAPVERYWLLLPPRDSDGVMNPTPEVDLPGSQATAGSALRSANARDPEATVC